MAIEELTYQLCKPFNCSLIGLSMMPTGYPARWTDHSQFLHSPLEKHEVDSCPAATRRPPLICSLMVWLTLLLYAVW